MRENVFAYLKRTVAGGARFDLVVLDPPAFARSRRDRAAAQRGYKVIVPVDGMSSDDTYLEQYAAWHMYKGGPAIVIDQVTLTRADMISF